MGKEFTADLLMIKKNGVEWLMLHGLSSHLEGPWQPGEMGREFHDVQQEVQIPALEEERPQALVPAG